MSFIKTILKNVFIKILNPVLILFFSLFYDKRYLTGRHFTNSANGVIWCFKNILWQKLFRINSNIPWPTSPFIRISNPDNIIFNPDDLNNFQTFGNYYQNFNAKIYIGHNSYIAPNVGIITANHNPLNLNEHLLGKDVIIGENCWIGMNSIILPGVKLGNQTIVGAGSIVTKSFPEGHCIIAGNPAKKIKSLSEILENKEKA